MLRVEKGEPEWRPVPAVKRRSATAQTTEEAKFTPKVVEKMKEFLAATEGKTVGPRNQVPVSIYGRDDANEVQTGQPFDEAQDHKSKPHEDGSGDAVNEAVAEFDVNTSHSGDAVHDGVNNEAELEAEVKTELVEVEDHQDDAMENSVKELEDGGVKELEVGGGGTDKEAIPETDNGTTKATGNHGEGVLSVQLKDKVAVLLENGKKPVEAAKMEVDGNVAPIEVSKKAAKDELTAEKVKGHEITAEVPAMANGDEKEKEKEEET